MRWRLLFLCIVIAAIQTAIAPSVSADPAGPTDYRTVISNITPATEGFEIKMIGGDSFMFMQVVAGTDVMVQGYQSEPYLWFRSDGLVLENLASPATWLNQDRYGDGELPEIADAEAPPQWRKVSESGRYAWHDHRSHWMNSAKPPGAESGDQILSATVPMRVNGATVTVSVESFLLASPSPLPMVAGLIGAVAAVAATLRRGRIAQMILAIVSAGAALALGVVAWSSLPVETEPNRLLWLLPLIGVAAAVAVLFLRNRLSTTVYLDGLTMTAGGVLVAWAILRLDALWRSLIPSDAPAWLDRAAIAAAVVVGAVLVLRGLFGLANPKRLSPKSLIT